VVVVDPSVHDNLNIKKGLRKRNLELITLVLTGRIGEAGEVCPGVRILRDPLVPFKSVEAHVCEGRADASHSDGIGSRVCGVEALHEPVPKAVTISR
jgi:hypothetical protein